MEAVVVGGLNIGEADRIVYLLSAGFGRTRAVARGARKSKKRFAGKLDPGCRLHVTTRGGRTGLSSITDVELVDAPHRAREDLDRIALLAYGCEICSSLAAEEEPSPRQYGLLLTWLLLLEGEVTPGPLVRVALEAKALTFAGFTPALTRCSRCGLALDDPCVFDPESGGGLHQRCGSGRVLPAETLRTIEALRRTPMRDLVDNPVEVPTQDRWLMSNFIRYQLGRGLKSRGLLEDLAQMNPQR
jgi:DNA repair protein RecO (recombination protein O)